MEAQVEVRAGQVWADNDSRTNQRTIRILDVSDTYAEALTLTDYRGRASTKITRIRLDRFRPNSTGYRLVSEPTP